MLQGCPHKVVTILLSQARITDLSEQPCNKSDNFDKVVTSCQQVVPNLLTTCDKQCECIDSLLADLLQDVRILRVYQDMYVCVFLRTVLESCRESSSVRKFDYFFWLDDGYTWVVWDFHDSFQFVPCCLFPSYF
jgi:hypothetical protein